MNPLLRKAYRIHGTAQLINFLGQSNPRHVTGIMCDYDAPVGFVPGKTDDNRKGYGPGSEILTRGGQWFKCRTGDTGAAVWDRVITEPAIIGEKDEAPEDPVETTEPVVETDETTLEKGKEEVKTKPVVETEETKDDETPEVKQPVDTGLTGEKPDFTFDNPKFADLPFRKYLEDKDNKIFSIYDLVSVVESGKLSELKYFNTKRASTLIAWLEENGHLDME